MEKFIELFEQMEQEHGPCLSVVIDHLDQFGVNSSGKLSDVNCSIEYWIMFEIVGLLGMILFLVGLVLFIKEIKDAPIVEDDV